MFDKNPELFIIGLIVACVMMFIGAIYFSEAQSAQFKLNCYDVNKHRSAAEAALLCKK